MLITASKTKAAELAEASVHKAVKWITDTETGMTFYWKPEDATHAEVAKDFHIHEFTKGIAII